jgi:hypothetical protein
MARRGALGAAVLTFIGGLFVLLGAILSAAFGLLLRLARVSADFLFLGIPIALLILLMAVLMYFVPTAHVAWGAATILLAFLSLVFAAFGGLVIGFLLCLVGGVLAIFARPGPRYLPQMVLWVGRVRAPGRDDR